MGGVFLACVTASGCSSSFKPGHRLVPGPGGAIGAAPLSEQRIAILAGSPYSKGVFIIDLNSGVVEKSFGVTREATGVASVGTDGPLLLTVGGQTSAGRAFGSVEEWTLNGLKTKVLPMPSEARGITRVAAGAAYVLVGNGVARAAIPVRVPSLSVGRPLALEANAKTLQQCVIGASPYLFYSSGPQGTIVVREIETGVVVRSTVVADSPTCITGRPQVFAISHSFAAASVVMLSLPTLLQQGLIPASNDATALYETDDHHLAALNATPRLSNIELFSDDAISPKAGSR